MTYSNVNEYWNERFWYWATRKGSAVTAAAAFARDEAAAAFASFEAGVTGVNSMHSNSQGAVVLYPAGWG